MYGHDTLFHYFSRRARQEQIAATHASSSTAAAAHRTLSTLHAARALLEVATDPAPGDCRTEAVVDRSAVAA